MNKKAIRKRLLAINKYGQTQLGGETQDSGGWLEF